MFGVNAQRRSGPPRKAKRQKRPHVPGRAKKAVSAQPEPRSVAAPRRERPSIKEVMASRTYESREAMIKDMMLLLGPEGVAMLAERVGRLEGTMAELGEAALNELGDAEDAEIIEKA